jgi:propionyl-CoA carboxylase alpha chain/3-methylcrotonyl-CoA carboxylase alpha subunit
VTEEITGQDLVEWQLRVASGEPLPKRQEELAINGWAMEARLYAEDPSREFLPSIGKLKHFRTKEPVRIDTGVEEGDQITPFYDPMIAKLVAKGATRAEALGRLRLACSTTEVWPVRTNAAFLTRCCDDPAFGGGEVHTGFIPERLDRLVDVGITDAALLSAVSWRAEEFEEAGFGSPGTSVWSNSPKFLFGFRLNAPAEPARFTMHSDAGMHEVVVAPCPRGADWEYQISIDGRTDFSGAEQGLPTSYGTAPAQPFTGELYVFDQGQAYTFEFDRPSGTGGEGGAGDGAIISPMPGRVIAVEVRQGDSVAKGQKLLTLEAMKMEHSLTAPFDGIVAELNAAEGAQVTEGTLLVRVEKGE